MKTEKPYKNWSEKLLVIGNHPMVISLWGVIGVICAVIAPVLFVDEEYVLTWMGISGTSMCALNLIGHSLREMPLMRVRGRWFENSSGCYFSTAIAHGLALSCDPTPDSAVGFILICVAVFCLMQIAMPSYDFDLLQSFLLAPVMVAAACYRDHGVWQYIVWAALLFMFGTAWHLFFHEAMERPRIANVKQEGKQIK